MLRDSPGFTATGGGPGINISGGDRPEQLRGIHVSHEFMLEDLVIT